MGYMLCLLFLTADLAIAIVCIFELIRRGGWDR